MCLALISPSIFLHMQHLPNTFYSVVTSHPFRLKPIQPVYQFTLINTSYIFDPSSPFLIRIPILFQSSPALNYPPYTHLKAHSCTPPNNSNNNSYYLRNYHLSNNTTTHTTTRTQHTHSSASVSPLSHSLSLFLSVSLFYSLSLLIGKRPLIDV